MHSQTYLLGSPAIAECGSDVSAAEVVERDGQPVLVVGGCFAVAVAFALLGESDARQPETQKTEVWNRTDEHGYSDVWDWEVIGVLVRSIRPANWVTLDSVVWGPVC